MSVLHIYHAGLFVGGATRGRPTRGAKVGLLHASLRVVAALVIHIDMVGLLVCGTPDGWTGWKAKAWTAGAAAGVVAVSVRHVDHARLLVGTASCGRAIHDPEARNLAAA